MFDTCYKTPVLKHTSNTLLRPQVRRVQRIVHRDDHAVGYGMNDKTNRHQEGKKKPMIGLRIYA